MHVPEHDLFDTVFNLRSLLRPHGRLLVSLPLTRDDVLSGERSTDGRLFKTYTPDYLQLLLERTGFQQIGRWETEDALGRTGTTTRSKRMTHAKLEARDVPAPSELSGGGFFGSRRP